MKMKIIFRFLNFRFWIGDEDVHTIRTLWKSARGEASRLRGKNYKVWKDGFHPVLLSTTHMLEQRINYIHENPMELEIIDHPKSWINSSYLAYEDENHIPVFKLSVLDR